MHDSHYAKPPAFHADEFEPSTPEDARFHIIPVPWEASVSYGGGTRNGPNAILHASLQLEAYIDGSTPGNAGIYTAPEIDCSGHPEAVLARIQEAATRTLSLGKIPILLGGEHAMTLAPIQAIREQGRAFGVVQFDAHADLRDSYEGSPYSHACVMKRIADLNVPVFQIGVRALSLPEAELRKQRGNISYLDAAEIAKNGFPSKLLPDNFPKNIFITFDVDGLDPSIMPMTGTPVPGGLTWHQAIEGLEKAIAGRRVLGADVVELAPAPHHHASEFAAANLVYKIMQLIG